MRKLALIVSFFCVFSALLYKAKNITQSIQPNAISKTSFDLFDSEEEEEREREERKGDHPDQFALFNQAIRTKEGESHPGYKSGYLLNELKQAQAARKSLQNSTSAKTDSNNGVLAWTERGPANIPGRTLAILDLPGDANHATWLAGSATGGLWKTGNGGTNWTEKSKDFTTLPIGSLAMSKSNTNVIYAGTGEYVSTVSTAVGDGIWKSTDQGETWQQLTATASNTNFEVVTSIIVDPTNVNNVLATCVSPYFNYTSTVVSTIQRSTDGGATWTTVYQSPAALEQIVYTPDNFNVQYASQYGVGVLKSTDGGLTWLAANQNLSVSGRVALSVSPVKTSRIYASAEGSLSGKGADLYFSDDAGVTWSLIDVAITSGTDIDFLGGQGYYDNTIACDPYNKDIVYFGGVNYFRNTLGTTTTTLTNYSLDESKTSNYISLVNSGASYAGGKLTIANSPAISVEIRFGPDKKQKAHRFLVPSGSTSGVASSSYTYQDYVDVNFEVWDVTNNKQLMVSFRDQGRDGAFNLITLNTTSTVATQQSREYIFVNNIAYNATTPDPTIAVAGGQQTKLIYNIWPTLATSATWPTTTNVTLGINLNNVLKYSATTITVCDAYSAWNGKNKANQTDFTSGVHPDHHTTTIIPVDDTAKTYKFLLGNDGGVFYSNTSTTPGITDGTIKFAGYGYNTGQFYSADKKPGADEYLGGLQDNGTRFSPSGTTASATTNYNYAISGDGFEVLWHSLDSKKMLGSIYYGDIYKSTNGGTTWTESISGLTGAGGSSNSNYPFFTKLSNSKSYPDRVFTVGASGVYVSNDFGSSWVLTSISSNFSGASFFADVEVSRSNAGIVWAGSGMSSSRNLYVSTNGGTSFTATTNYTGATLGGLTKIATHPTQDSTAYALFSFADSPKILRTKDLGKTWTDISGFGSGTSSTNGFPDVGVFCLYVRPDNPNIIWAGTEIGIVESLDDGKTWNLLTDFLHVNVWDMKGQDNEIVIATHGRGIWTATVVSSQMNTVVPAITSAGTSPQSKFMLNVTFPVSYDSAQVYINSSKIGTLKTLSATSYKIAISGVSAGSVTVKVIAYNGSAPTQSAPYTQTHLALNAYQVKYYNLFNSSSDITGVNSSSSSSTSFAVSTLTSPNTSLQSNHNYDLNATLTAYLLQPIIVTSANPTLYYKDVAIVVNDGDYVTLEGSKDGLTWKTLKANYNSSANTNWAAAVSAGSAGTDALQVSENVAITPTFTVGDTLLFRFKLYSNTVGNAWGWSIDDLYIQQAPTGVESLYASQNELNFGVYPNPVSSKTNTRIFFELTDDAPVQLAIIDFTGKLISNINLGTKQKGANEEVLNLNLEQGVYFVKINTAEGSSVKRLLVTD